MGPRGGLLPDLPGPLRGKRSHVGDPAHSSRGTRRRRVTGSRAAISWASPNGSRISPTSASTRSISRRSSARPRTTATTRTTTTRSTRSSAATRHSASCWTRPTGAACASSSTASSTTRARVLGVPPRPGERCLVALPRLVPRRHPPARAPAGRCGVSGGAPAAGADGTRRAAAGTRRAMSPKGVFLEPIPAPSRLRAWWDLPALPKLDTANPAVARLPPRRRRALAPVRDRRLAPRRPDRDRRRAVLAGLPRRVKRVEPGRLPRRRDLARGAGRGSRATSSTR